MLLIFFLMIPFYWYLGNKITQMPKATLDSYPSSMELVLGALRILIW